MFNEEAFSIRFSEYNDGNALKSWLLDPRLSIWSVPKGEAETALFVRNWESLVREKSSISAFYKDRIVAIASLYPLLYRKVCFAAVGSIWIDPDYIDFGLQPSLLKNFKHLAKSYFHLEAIQIELYGKDHPMMESLLAAGFYSIYEQEGFFEQGDHFLPRICLQIDLESAC